MATVPLSSVVGQLCRTVRPEASLSDEQLLQDYISRKDPAAFECLVWRHGPTVLGACRRILGNEADAEDAFQATFLVFLRKAKSLQPRSAVGAWLYGVACNVARKERENAVRRRAKELAAAQRPKPELPDPDLKPAIDFEVERLPEKYRVPIVLCELEGQPIADTAQQLGWPQGTVASRLARGRDLLARRLTRHGFSIASLASATLTTELVARVVKQSTLSGTKAGRLAEGVINGMFMAKLKFAMALVVFTTVVLFGGLTLRSFYGEPETPAEKDPAKQEKPISDEPPKKAEPEKALADSFIGRWRMLGNSPYRTLEFREQPDDGLLIAEMKDHKAHRFSWKIDVEKPGTIDVSARVKGASVPNKGIYKFDGERLVIFFGAPFQFGGDPGKHSRPDEFENDVKVGDRMIVLEREQVAWGKIDENGLQFGLAVEPPGQKTIPLGTSVTFSVLVRNTTNKAIDVDVPKFDGNPYEWQLSILGPKGEAISYTQPIAIPGIAKPSTRMKAQLIDYGVAEVGTFTIGLLPSPGYIAGVYPPPAVLLSPGEHTFQFSMKPEKDRLISTGKLKLTMEHAVGWGPNVKGLEFGLALGKGQSKKIHVGERARFRILARNTSDKEIKIGTLQALHLPMFAEPRFWADDVNYPVVRFVRGPRVDPPPPNLTILAGQTVDIPGEFVLPFVPHSLEGQTHVLARIGKWPISIPKLDTWVAGVGIGTGEVTIEIVPGDVAHTDSQRIAWGAVAEGIQFGLRSDKGEYAIGDTVKFAVLARNMSDKRAFFRFPQLAGFWPNNGKPIVKDADGKEVKPHLAVPRGPIGPQAVSGHELNVGEMAEITSVSWPFVGPDKALSEGRDYVVITKPGTYTFQYPDLHAKNKPAWPTGELQLKFSAPIKPALPDVSWGKEKNGLQFGIALAQSQLKNIRVGESVSVQIWVKNTTDKEQKYNSMPVPALKYSLMPEVSGNGQTWTSGKNPPPGSPQPRLDVKVPAGAAQLAGEMEYDFLPGYQLGCNGLKALPGRWQMRFADLSPWLTTEGFATGEVPIEVLPGDVAHVDKAGISWGKAVDGVQMGIVHVDPTQTEFTLNQKLALHLWVRNFSGANQEVSLPPVSEVWKEGTHPIVRNAKGSVMQIGLPIKPLARRSIREQSLRIGEKADWGKVDWPLAELDPNQAREFNVPTILVDPGEHTIEYLDIPRSKKGAAAHETGALKFVVK